MAMVDPNKQILHIIHTINDICKQGKGFNKLAPHFHKDVVMVLPGFTTQAKGREVCLKSYEDACSQMAFHKFAASEEKIDVYGNTAVACYKYDCIWEYKEKKLEDDGHEILVLVKEDTDWQVAWRTLIPGSRQVETCPTEAESSKEKKVYSKLETSDVKQTCLDLLTLLPVCHLTTIDAEGFPHTNAMFNLRCTKAYPSIAGLYEDSGNTFLLYLTTPMQSQKMARMQVNPKVSVYFCDADNLVDCMLGGEIEIVTDQALKSKIWQKGWAMYYPNGPEGPEYGVIKLEPTVVKGRCKNHPFEIKVKGEFHA